MLLRQRLLPVLLFAVSVWVVTPAKAGAVDHHITMLAHVVDDTMRGCWGYIDSLGREIALVCSYSNLDLYDVTDPTNPILRKRVPQIADATDLKAVRPYHDSIAYVGNQSGLMQIVYIWNADNAQTIGSFATPLTGGNHTIEIFGDYMYLGMNGASDRRIQIWSLANPAAPTKIISLANPGTGFNDGHDCYVHGDTIYTHHLTAGFKVWNIANKAAPVGLATVSYPGVFQHASWTSSDGKILYTDDETDFGRLRVWNVSDLRQIIQLANYAPSANAGGVVHNVYLFQGDDLAYTGCYEEGVRILDVSDPTYPIEVGGFDTSPGNNPPGPPSAPQEARDGVWDAYLFPSGTLIATDRKFGFWTLRFDGSRAGRIEGTVTNSVTGQPLPDAKVKLINLTNLPNVPSVLTGTDGSYGIRTGSVLQNVEVSRFGFRTDTVQVTGIVADTVPLNVALDPVPYGTISGQVTRSATGDPIAGVIVGLAGEPYHSDTTDGSGNYSINFVPADSNFLIETWKWGFQSAQATVLVTAGGNATANFGLRSGYSDDFEHDLGWTVGDAGDDATAGFWTRVEPFGMKNFANSTVQPDTDHTAPRGQRCWITGQGRFGIVANDQDVDDGKTTLLSPMMDLSGFSTPVLSYWRWFSNNGDHNPDEDTLEVSISSDGGISWVVLERTTATENRWTSKQFCLTSKINLTSNVRFRVVISDRRGPSLVEGAFDDFAVLDRAAGDINNDRTVDIADITQLITHVVFGTQPPNPLCFGDLNCDGVIDIVDVVQLILFVVFGAPAPCTP